MAPEPQANQAACRKVRRPSAMPKPPPLGPPSPMGGRAGRRSDHCFTRQCGGGLRFGRPGGNRPNLPGDRARGRTAPPNHSRAVRPGYHAIRFSAGANRNRGHGVRTCCARPRVAGRGHTSGGADRFGTADPRTRRGWQPADDVAAASRRTRRGAGANRPHDTGAAHVEITAEKPTRCKRCYETSGSFTAHWTMGRACRRPRRHLPAPPQFSARLAAAVKPHAAEPGRGREPERQQPPGQRQGRLQRRAAGRQRPRRAPAKPSVRRKTAAASLYRSV